ncbi:MAG TPA: hypothetical protein VGK73_10835 [Polyangiaceae bacterium]
MEFISVGQHAVGFIAIGQEARGFFALGQVATGVIAIGQLARGVLTLGQLGFGFIGWGQVGFGILHAVGMVGAGGRGLGLVVPLVPSVGRARVPPQTIAIERALAGQSGWVAADLFYDEHGLGLGSGGHRLPVKFDRRLQGGANALTVHGPRTVWAFLRRIGPLSVCERIQHAPPRPYEKPGFYLRGAFQFVGLVILATAWWVVVGQELIGILGELSG